MPNVSALAITQRPPIPIHTRTWTPGPEMAVARGSHLSSALDAAPEVTKNRASMRTPIAYAESPTWRPNRGSRTGLALLLLGFVLAILFGSAGCSTTPEDSDTDPESLAAQISALQESIARDHRTLEGLVTRTRDENIPALHDDAELREIADRIMLESSELQRLESLANGSATLLPDPAPLPQSP